MAFFFLLEGSSEIFQTTFFVFGLKDKDLNDYGFSPYGEIFVTRRRFWCRGRVCSVWKT